MRIYPLSRREVRKLDSYNLPPRVKWYAGKVWGIRKAPVSIMVRLGLIVIKLVFAAFLLLLAGIAWLNSIGITLNHLQEGQSGAIPFFSLISLAVVAAYFIVKVFLADKLAFAFSKWALDIWSGKKSFMFRLISAIYLFLAAALVLSSRVWPGLLILFLYYIASRLYLDLISSKVQLSIESIEAGRSAGSPKENVIDVEYQALN